MYKEMYQVTLMDDHNEVHLKAKVKIILKKGCTNRRIATASVSGGSRISRWGAPTSDAYTFW